MVAQRRYLIKLGSEKAVLEGVIPNRILFFFFFFFLFFFFFFFGPFLGGFFVSW